MKARRDARITPEEIAKALGGGSAVPAGVQRPRSLTELITSLPAGNLAKRGNLVPTPFAAPVGWRKETAVGRPVDTTSRGTASAKASAPLSLSPKPRPTYPVLDMIGKINGSGNTVAGLIAAGASWAAGKAMNTNPTFKLGNNALQLLNSPLNLNNRAYTLGNVQIYGPGDGPDKNQMSYTKRVVNNGRHEEGHTLQSQFMGPGYIPLQLVGMLFGDDNPWDVGADDYALGHSRTGF